MKKIKVGLIGAGFIGGLHIDALRRLGYVEIVALVENDLRLAKRKAEEYLIPKYYDDYRYLLEDNEIDVIHNCTPNSLHYKINKDVILSGKHIFSEKPLAVNAKEARELADMAKAAKIIHGVNFNYRQYPLVQEMRSRIISGKAGRVFLVHGHYLQDWLLYNTDYNWRLETETGGMSRAIADIGSHWCDIAQFITGKRISEVFADLTTVHPYRIKPFESTQTFDGINNNDSGERIKIYTEDCGEVLIHFDDGTNGIFYVSQVSAGRKNQLSISVDCENYSMEWNQEEPDTLFLGYRDKPNELLSRDPLLLSKEAKTYARLPGGHGEAWCDGLKNNISDFYSFILNSKDLKSNEVSFATFEDGFKIMCIVEAIIQSHKDKEWVTVKY